jgi:hypothetical protein
VAASRQVTETDVLTPDSLDEVAKARLLAAYRPLLRYDSQAAFLAVSAATITDNPTNRLLRGKDVLAAASGVPMLSLDFVANCGPASTSDGDVQDTKERVPGTKWDRLHRGPNRLIDACRMQSDPRYADTVHGRAVLRDGRLFLQYWLWFYSAPFPRPLSFVNFRELFVTNVDEGAWRLVQIEVRGDAPARVALQSADATYDVRDWSDLDHGNPQGPVDVYVSPFTQNLYFEPGFERRGQQWDGCDGEGYKCRPGVQTFDGWEHWPGHWGSTEAGPKSPGATDVWKTPERRTRRPKPEWRRRLDATWQQAIPDWYQRRRGVAESKTPRMPVVRLRLDGGRVVLAYQHTHKPWPTKLYVTVHRRTRDDESRRGEVIALANVSPARRSGETQVVLPDAVDCCDVRISALSGIRERVPALFADVAANQPDELEESMLASVIHEELRSPRVVRFITGDVTEEDLRATLTAQGPRIWSTVASELQTFRTARSAHESHAHARAEKARATRAAAVALLLLVASVVGLVAAVSDETLVWILTIVPTTLPVAGILAAQQWARRRAAVAELRRWPDVTSGKEETPLQDARHAFERVLREKGVAPVVRERLNEETKERYDGALDFGDEGLQELLVPEYEVATEASDRLAALTRRMRGGSVGIAGPRGVGKTTLINTYCKPQTTNDTRLATVLAAPVRYDARDFVLTLFGQLCEAVLGTEAASALTAARGRVDSRLYSAIPVLMVGAGVAWGAEQTTEHVRRWALLAVGVSVLLILVGIGLRVRWRPFVAVILLTWVAIALGALALEFLDNVVERIALGLLALLVVGFAIDRFLRARFRAAPHAPDTAEERLRANAERCLTEIRFQQSYSEGYSGKLTLPVGGELSKESRQDLAAKQATFPQIVASLRAFLALAVKARGEVAIGIDEMDKMESGEVAQQFLNEIKGIFGVERCFYLVSISEGAMSSFERRGLPFRDVFDSSFDEVLSVAPLPLDHAKDLLRGRVVGLGPPYMDLCHCLSGGLPRDLLRVVRQLSLHNGQGMAMDQVCTELVKAELERKVEATTVSAREIVLEPHVSEFLLWLRELATEDLTPTTLRVRSAALQADSARLIPDDEKALADYRDLARLRAELAAFTYYLATVLQLFGGVTGDPAAYFGVVEAGEDTRTSRIDALARARTAFSVNPRVAVAIVDEFRETQWNSDCRFTWHEPTDGRSRGGQPGAQAAPQEAPAASG